MVIVIVMCVVIVMLMIAGKAELTPDSDRKNSPLQEPPGEFGDIPWAASLV